jgi:hypothetical protein
MPLKCEGFREQSDMTEQTPTDLLRAIVGMFPEFEEYWGKEGDIFREADGSFSYHGLFAVFSHFVRGGYKQMSEVEKERVFRLVEICMSKEGGTGEVGNAVQTCFIENLAGDLPPGEVRRYAGPEAVKAFSYYDG